METILFAKSYYFGKPAKYGNFLNIETCFKWNLSKYVKPAILGMSIKRNLLILETFYIREPAISRNLLF